MAQQPSPPAFGGTCDAAFAEVQSEFERNFRERDELGASVCVIHEGRTVVDLWGGSADAAGNSPWREDTIVVVFSCTKGATALCAHILASRGELDFDIPVGRYWPEFASHGKSEITVRMLLNHQAGLPGISRAVDVGTARDFEAMVNLLSQERPLWRPGTRYGYHALTFGWLLGEIIRRVSGQTVGAFFHSHVAEPLALDFWIGLPPNEQARVAPVVAPAREPTTPLFDEAVRVGEPVQLAVLNSRGGVSVPELCDTPQGRQVEIPAANGITNARGLAGMYAPLSLGGDLGSISLVDEEQLSQMIATESAATSEAVYLEPCRHSAGFEKASLGALPRNGRTGLLISELAFGHSGLGGAVGFADPARRFSFGYAMNRHARPDEAIGARRQPLIDATYEALSHS
jgi:CubicO group peptidase (beta-lactamase class C family)